ncbi:MAG: hypothetical protein WCO84_04055 [bacterium]
MEYNKKTKLYNNLKIAIAINILVLLLYFGLFYLVKSKNDSELAVSISNLNNLQSIQDSYSGYHTALTETVGEREKLNSLMVNKRTAAVFIEDLEKLAKHSGVEVTKTVSVEKQVPQANENMLVFNVRAKGSLRDVFYFTLLEESMPYKTRFKKIVLSSGDISTNSDLLSIAGGKGTSQTKESPWVGEASFELLSYINE